MPNVPHSALANDELHEPFHRVASIDPGAIGANKYWLDTSGANPMLKRRNGGNTAWLTVGSAAQLAPDYTLFRSGNTYLAYNRSGALAYSFSDTATTSGFKAVLSAILPQGASNLHIHLAANTRFHYLDAPLGNESWAGVEDHMSFVKLRDVTFSGGGWGTIVSNRTNWGPTGTDVEPFSFTNSQGITIRDLQVECCGCNKSTTGAVDFDQGVDCRLLNVRITRTRGAQAVVCDGGDTGKYAGRNQYINCVVQGRPQSPEIDLLNGGALGDTVEYRYCVSWVDKDLGGANVSAETMPSKVQSITTTSTQRATRLSLQIGPYTCTARKIYRWDSVNGWRLLTTVNDNTTLEFDDNGSLSLSAVPAAFTEHRSTIMGSGYELLSCQDSLIQGCVADGVGDKINGQNQYSFNIVRKGTLIGANRNRIIGCMSDHSGSHAYRISGGSDNVISSCTARNPGTVASKASFVRIEGAVEQPTNRNIVMGVRGIDDQDANSPSGGVSTSNAVSITATNAPTNNQLAICTFTGHSATAVSDLGTGTVQTAVITS